MTVGGTHMPRSRGKGKTRSTRLTHGPWNLSVCPPLLLALSSPCSSKRNDLLNHWRVPFFWPLPSAIAASPSPCPSPITFTPLTSLSSACPILTSTPSRRLFSQRNRTTWDRSEMVCRMSVLRRLRRKFGRVEPGRTGVEVTIGGGARARGSARGRMEPGLVWLIERRSDESQQ